MEDNFFELGGDSIVSIQVVSRARQAGLGLTPRDLFRYPTIAELARAAETGAGAPAAEQGEVTGPAELTPVQRWFFEQDVPAPQYFGQSVTVELSASPDPAVLEAALGALLAHHDALRMRFTRDADGHWHQHNADVRSAAGDSSAIGADHQAPAGPSLVAWRDLSERTAEAQQAAIDAAAEDLHASLDLAGRPPAGRRL